MLNDGVDIFEAHANELLSVWPFVHHTPATTNHPNSHSHIKTNSPTSKSESIEGMAATHEHEGERRRKTKKRKEMTK